MEHLEELIELGNTYGIHDVVKGCFAPCIVVEPEIPFGLLKDDLGRLEYDIMDIEKFCSVYGLVNRDKCLYQANDGKYLSCILKNDYFDNETVWV